MTYVWQNPIWIACLNCGQMFLSGSPKAKFCCRACKRAWNEKEESRRAASVRTEEQKRLGDFSRALKRQTITSSELMALRDEKLCSAVNRILRDEVHFECSYLIRVHRGVRL